MLGGEWMTGLLPLVRPQRALTASLTASSEATLGSPWNWEPLRTLLSRYEPGVQNRCTAPSSIQNRVPLRSQRNRSTGERGLPTTYLRRSPRLAGEAWSGISTTLAKLATMLKPMLSRVFVSTIGELRRRTYHVSPEWFHPLNL